MALRRQYKEVFVFTYEDALYHKLLLEAGVTDELLPAVERLLAEEEPLSEVAVDLAYANDDANKQLSALNEYLSKADERSLNMDTVLEKLMGYFRKTYEKNTNAPDGLINIMYSVGMHDQYTYDNWQQLWMLNDYYCLSLDGTITKNSFKECLEAYLYKGMILDPLAMAIPKRKPDLLERIKNALKGVTGEQ